MNKKQQQERHPEPNLRLRAVQKWLNVVEAPRIENRRLLGITLLISAVAIAEGVALAGLTPLKEKVPYTVEVETDANGARTGNVMATNRLAEQFVPGENNIRYFLGKWAVDLTTVDEFTKEVRLPTTYQLLRGKAMDDWRYYVTDQAQPLVKLSNNPGFRERAELVSITFLSDDTAMIRVKLTDGNRQTKRIQLTVTFAILPPATDEDVQRNPIGLWITTFGVNNELA
jgi:type IV secretory pathway component VirB8